MVTRLVEVNEKEPLNDPAKKQIIDEIIDRNAEKPGAVMVVLNELQTHIGYISDFSTTPNGRHTIKFCMGTACYVGGMPQIIKKAKQVVGVDFGETTADGDFTLELCRSVGTCSQAPVLVIDAELVGRVQPNKFPKLIQALRELV